MCCTSFKIAVQKIFNRPAKIDPAIGNEQLGLSAVIKEYGFISEPSTEKTDESNQDAFYRGDDSHGQLTYAVADGVSQSPDARNWAQRLVGISPLVLSHKDSFVSEFFKMQSAYLEDWEGRKNIILENNKNNWRFNFGNRSTINTPSGATYCSVTFHKTDEGLQYHALAIGDSCLFHISDGKLHNFFPLEKIEDFSRPPCVAYAGISKESLVDPTIGLQTCSGSVKEGDFIILATDAIAKWIYAQYSSPDSEVKNFRELLMLAKANDVDGMRAYISKERMNATLQDDDTTLLILRVNDGNAQ